MSDLEKAPLIASASQTVGPFFHIGPGAEERQVGMVAAPDVPGSRVRLRIRVLDGDGVPVPDALIELRQADARGVYGGPVGPGEPTPAFAGFGRLATSADGWCDFDTIRPGAPGDGEAAHVTLCVFMRGLQRHLYTRVYFGDDPALDRDPILALVPAERRPTLIARRTDDGVTWESILRLQGEDETVFFDV
jgi:protocatechuate 3,4-dioxygenase, alpha subunit